MRTAASNDGFAIGTFQSFIDDSLNITQSEPTPLNLDVTDNGAVSASLKSPDNQVYTTSGYGFNVSSDDLGEFVPFFTPRLPNAPLSLNLLSFTATKQTEEVKLNWTAIRSAETKFYEVERSSELKNWSILGSRIAVGQPGELAIYNYLDEAPEKGENYYRLRAIDLDGEIDHSDVRLVSFDANDQVQKLAIYPNPSNGNFQILGLPVSDYDLRIIDAQARVVYLEKGRNASVFKSPSKLAPGVYQIQIIGAESQVLPLIVR